MRVLAEIVGYLIVAVAVGYGATWLVQTFARGLASQTAPTNNKTKESE